MKTIMTDHQEADGIIYAVIRYADIEPCLSSQTFAHTYILRTLARPRHCASSAPQVGDSGDPGHEEARQTSATPNETSALTYCGKCRAPLIQLVGFTELSLLKGSFMVGKLTPMATVRRSPLYRTPNQVLLHYINIGLWQKKKEALASSRVIHVSF